MVRNKFILFAALAVLVFTGCFMAGVATEYEEMSPKQKSAYFMDMYNGQYRDYLDVSSREGLTENDKIVLRKKKELLTQLYSTIKIYDSIMVTGIIPSQDAEDNVLKFLNELLYWKGGG